MPSENKFGDFFRKSRQALGLNLREFCRQNGFDPGNVSRLERGLVSPPQTQEALETYAKALKLKPCSDLWNELFALAFAETGRLPTEVLADDSTSRRLPDLFRQLRRGSGHRNWVRAKHFENWAGTLDARSLLPQLIRRLIHATGKGVSRIEFPSGDQVQRPDVDGIVEASEPEAFVPGGLSFWEMGTDKNPKGKAEKDFEKRRAEPLGVEKRKTTYVVVTPRKWQLKRDWVRAKSNLRVWKEVRVYDSAALEEWIEQAPAVDVWLAQLIGRRPEGLTDLSDYWANLQALTDPSLKPEVFLASRQKQFEEFQEWLKGPPGALVIKTRSPGEAVDFVVAASQRLTEQEAFEARTVIVEDRAAWKSIASSDHELILIPHPKMVIEPEMVAEAVRQRHRVVLHSGEVQGEDIPAIHLPRVYRSDLRNVLASSGLDTPKAEDFARKAGGSLTVLKRLLARFPGTAQPEWSIQPNATPLIPLLLAGSWEDGVVGDRRALERLSNESYSEVLSRAEQWLEKPDPPLRRVLTRWNLVSRDDSWYLLAPAIGRDHLKRFEEVALTVLGEEDPAYELPPDKRWHAGLYRKVSPYSYALRMGIAETLALLGGLPERVKSESGLPGRVERIVQTLLEGQDWKRWASLSPQLPLLAEAAPEAFLRAANKDLDDAKPALVTLFEQEGEPLFSSSPHTGLLWALEGLAWDRSLLPEAAYTLARLDELAPAGKLGNRPHRSLHEIFMPWYPQTTASVEERLRVLRGLTKRYPPAGWRLLLALLPQGHQHTAPIHRPNWRDWALGWKEGATNFEYWRQATGVAELLFDFVGKDVKRWQELVDRFESLPEPAQKTFFERLTAIDPAEFDLNARRALADTLREKIGDHRKYAQADWALPSDILTKLEELQKRFEPSDPVARSAWLFGSFWQVRDQVQGDDAVVAERRKAALSEILSSKGWDGILSLVAAAKAPDEVGGTLGDMGSPEYDSAILPKLLSSSTDNVSRFARTYVWRRGHTAGWQWVEGLDLKAWSGKAIGLLASNLSFEKRTWTFVAEQGSEAERTYWRNTPVFPRSTDPEDIRYVTGKLIENGRPLHACDFLAMAIHQEWPAEPDLVMDALRAVATRPSEENSRAALGNVRYDIHRLFQALQKGVREKAPGFDPNCVAQLEWQFLALLDGHPAWPETLHNMLSENPRFLIEVLNLIYRPKTEPKTEGREYSEQEKARAQHGYRLLSSWQKVPGTRDDETVDETVLSEWVRSARALAEEAGHLEMCDVKIGSVFAYAPPEKVFDKAWPCVPVRDALEEIGTDAVFDGFEVGVFNKRGVYSKVATEGGDKERSLAEKYRGYAEASSIEWPKTAASLKRIAQRYVGDAVREDARAELAD